MYFLIKGILEADPHSKFTKKKKDGVILFAFYVDLLEVIYDFDVNKNEVNIIKIKFTEESKKHNKKLRTKEWLDDNKNELDIDCKNSQMEQSELFTTQDKVHDKTVDKK